jgi:oligosaccharide repeat unit polymerase
MQSIKFGVNKSIQPSIFARNLLFYISLITFPLLLYKAYEITQLGGGVDWMSILRKTAVGGLKNVDSKETSPFYVIIWMVSYLIELYYFSNSNKRRVIILFTMYFFYAVISMSKTNFLSLFLSTILILYLKKTINTKHILIGIVGIFLFLFGFQSIRNKSDNKSAIKNFITLYLLTNPPAFETITANSSKNPGENTFKFFYAVKNKLGLSETEPVEQILPFVNVPKSTNTYSILYPAYKDYGNMGIIIFSIILGLLLGFVFKQAQERSILFIIIYSFLLPQIFMQFAGDMFLTNLSLNLKRIIIVLIPFIISKYNLFSKNNNFENDYHIEK